MKEGPAKHFFPVALAAAAVLFTLGRAMIQVSAPTYDEPVHLASGYTDLKSPMYHLNSMDHPPFAEMWAALPLLAFSPSTFFQHPDFAAARVYNFADHFLYKNRVPPDKLLDAARLWCLATWSTLAALGILSWSWRLAGTPGLWAAAVLFAFCPPLISNFSLVTTDSASAVFFFLTFLALSRERWLWAGLAMGLAMASKFNMIVLPPLAFVMLMVSRNIALKAGKKAPWRPQDLLLASSAALAVLGAVYRFESLPLYWKGLAATFTRLDQGRPSFLLGAHPTNGSLLYFPLAAAVKTPIPLLLAAGLFKLRWLRRPSMDAFWLLGPPAAYFIAACFAKTQIGLRHILPVYPFMIVMAACAAAWVWERPGWGRAACLAGALWTAASAARAHPHYLAYFNEAVGGPAQGYRYLVDSNLDWGQDLKLLGRRLHELGDPPVILCYFGVADPSYYGIHYIPLGYYTNVDRREGVVDPMRLDRVLLAVSATNLQATYYADKTSFDWLKTRRPVYTAGCSMFLYDLTDDREARLRLSALLHDASPGASGALVLK